MLKQLRPSVGVVRVVHRANLTARRLIEGKKPRWGSGIVGMMVGKLGALALVCVVAVSGCSMLGLAYGPSTKFWPPKKPACTSSEAAMPVLDTIVALSALTVVGVMGFSDKIPFIGCDDKEVCESIEDDLLPATLVTGVVFAASATVGWWRVNRCARAKDDYNRWQSTQFTPKPQGSGP